MLDFLSLQREQTPVSPHQFGEIIQVPITDTLITGIFVTLLLLAFGIWFRATLSLIPARVQNAFELLYDEMVELISQITASKSMAAEVFPLVAAIFVYIGVANVITLIPGIGQVTLGGEKLFRTPTSDINLPLALAIGSVALINVRAVAAVGFLSYLGRYFKFSELVSGFREGVKEGFLALVEFFVGLLDIIAEAAKVISLSFRLFGNMFAGELLAVLILGAVAVVLPSVWMSLSLLFAIVQALVFGALVASYWTLAVAPEGDMTEAEDGFSEDY